MEKWVSVAEAKRDLSKLLREMSEDQEIIITKRGNPYRAITSYEEYRTLNRWWAYMTMVRLSAELKEIGVTATELYEASRRELEERS